MCIRDRVYDIPIANNIATADFMIHSTLMNEQYSHQIENFKNTCTVMNGTLAWDISGKMDESDCIDIDPFTLYELKAINSLIA